MLAHLQHFDFSALLEYLDVSHILFLDLLDRNFFERLFVNGKFNEAKLPFAERLVLSVEIKDI